MKRSIPFIPLLSLNFQALCLTLVLMSMSRIQSYAGTDVLRKFSKEQSLAASRVTELILTGDCVTIFSLDPAKRRFPEDGHRKFFHGFRILGKADVTDVNDRKLLAAVLSDDIRGNLGIVAACFEPRHGLRAIKGSETKDIVICFECASARSYNFNSNRGFLVSGGSAPEFNKFLDRHHVRRVEAKD